MALNQSPKIVTDGLVLYYDMNNTEKSWRGQPTTNLCNFDVASSGFSTDTPGNLTQTANSSEVTYKGKLTRKMQILAAGYCNYYIYSYNTGVSSTVFAASCKIKTADDSHPNTFIQGGYIYGSAGSFYPSVTFTYLSDGWYQLSWLYSGSSMTLNSLTGLNGTAPSAKTFYMADYQLEALSMASPYVPQGSSRSTSQAVLDLTNNYSLTANSLRYYSNNTFSFAEGSSDNIVSNLPMSSLPALSGHTIEAWVKCTAFPSVSSPNGYGVTYKSGVLAGATYYSGAALYWYGDTAGATCTIYGFIRANDAYRATAGYQIGLNTYYHLVTTHSENPKKLRLYVNGVLYSEVDGATAEYNASNVAGAGNIGVSKAQVDGGGTANYSYFNGYVDSVKVYSRGLTAAEVLQNFNARAGRYIGSTSAAPATSASAILAAIPTAGNGKYWLQPVGCPAPFQAYIDFTTANGPWVHVGTAAGNTYGLWSLPATWVRRTTDSGSATDPTTTTSSFNAGAFIYCKGSRVMIKEGGGNSGAGGSVGYVQATGFSNESWRDVYKSISLTAWPSTPSYVRSLPIATRSAGITSTSLIYGTSWATAGGTTEWLVYVFDGGGDTMAMLGTALYNASYNAQGEADVGIGANEYGPTDQGAATPENATQVSGATYDAGSNSTLATAWSGVPFSLWIQN